MECDSSARAGTTGASFTVASGWVTLTGAMMAVRASSVGECATTQTPQRCASRLLEPWKCRASAVAAKIISSRQSTAVQRIKPAWRVDRC